MINDTIVALSTAYLTSAIGVIRMSGSKSFSIIRTIFNKEINIVNNRETFVGKIIDNNEVIDEVVLVCYKGPYSFTGEDTVEINCHGGLININRIISLIISKGARNAEHGEFSKKAYYNNKIDLIQAESINDFIMSKSYSSSKMALEGMNGNISNKIEEIKKSIVSSLALIDVNIDYPEYEDVEVLTNDKLAPSLLDLSNKLKEVLDKAEVGRIIKDGISVAIIGRPNAGKSSLLNALIEEDKAIVTEIEGTTRDVVEGKFIYKGITFNLLDTAGIRESSDKIEMIGIEKSKEAINKADIIITLLDGSIDENEINKDLIEFKVDKPNIIVINKSDTNKYKNDKYISISAKNKDVDILKDKLVSVVGVNVDSLEDFALLSNQRQIGLLMKAKDAIDNGYKASISNIPIDLVYVDVRNALDSINEILGKKSKEDLDDEIFSKFCIGK